MRRLDRSGIGWRLGRSHIPRGVDLWVPYDRTAGVYGPQGSGKTLDLLTPALLAAPGAALVTLTKPDDLLLTLEHRQSGGRPVAVLDPFGLAPGVPELVWDPVAGCVDSMLAERRAKAFTAGTVKGAVVGGAGDDAARFYAAEGGEGAAGVLPRRRADRPQRGARAGVGRRSPPRRPSRRRSCAPIRRRRRSGTGCCAGRCTVMTAPPVTPSTTVQQAMALFFQDSIRARCVPGPGRPGDRPRGPDHAWRHGVPAGS